MRELLIFELKTRVRAFGVKGFTGWEDDGNWGFLVEEVDLVTHKVLIDVFVSDISVHSLLSQFFFKFVNFVHRIKVISVCFDGFFF